MPKQWGSAFLRGEIYIAPKAEAVQVSTEVPAVSLQMHPNVAFVLDSGKGWNRAPPDALSAIGPLACIGDAAPVFCLQTLQRSMSFGGTRNGSDV